MLSGNYSLTLARYHDTTSSVASWTFYHLATQPSIMNQLREEHDRILGMDVEDAAHKITAEPDLLNQLVYTNAVMKETLRLFPPASSIRMPEPSYTVRYKDKSYPQIAGAFWWINHFAMHRHPGEQTLRSVPALTQTEPFFPLPR